MCPQLISRSLFGFYCQYEKKANLRFIESTSQTMECLLWQLADLSDQSRKDYQIQNSKNQRRLVGPNRESLHHHPQQPSQPRPGQRPDRYTPNHRSKAHPLETQKTPSVRPGTNRGQNLAMPHSKTANTGSFWPITCVSWRGVVHALQRHSASCGRMWIGANNSSPSARTA